MRDDHLFVHLPEHITITVNVAGVDSGGDAQIRAALARIETALGIIRQKEDTVALDLSRVQADVQANTDAVSSITTVVSTLVDELRAAAGDPAAVNALADQLEANNAALAAAIVTGTPADPNATPAP